MKQQDLRQAFVGGIRESVQLAGAIPLAVVHVVSSFVKHQPGSPQPQPPSSPQPPRR